LRSLIFSIWNVGRVVGRLRAAGIKSGPNNGLWHFMTGLSARASKSHNCSARYRSPEHLAERRLRHAFLRCCPRRSATVRLGDKVAGASTVSPWIMQSFPYKMRVPGQGKGLLG